MKSYYEEHIEDLAKEMKRRHYKSKDKEKFAKRFGLDKNLAEEVSKKMKEKE